MNHPSPAEFSAHLKQRLRQEAFARRDGLDKTWRQQASREIAKRALALPDLDHVEPVGGYWPIHSEVDPRPILRGLSKRGQSVALAQILDPHLIWRAWRPGDPLTKGRLGVKEPRAEAAECFPQALIVPLACFDRRGGRVGYGKGHFDRTIAALTARHPVLAVGLGYALQEIPEVPLEPHDRRLDYIVTETELICVRHG
jgi:5-formyltetrahydrofolate cyclo-ligase